MTVIAVKKYKNYVEIAADSQCTWGNQKNIKTKKIITINKQNNVYVGLAGHAKTSYLLDIFCTDKVTDKLFDKSSIFNFLLSFQQWIGMFEKDFILKDNFIITSKNKIYRSIGLGIEEISNYTAVGSGMFLAIGALELGASVKKAVEVAIKHDLYCGGNAKVIKYKI